MSTVSIVISLTTAPDAMSAEVLRRALEDSDAFSDVTEDSISTTIAFEATDIATGSLTEIEAKHRQAVYAALERAGLVANVNHIAVSG